MLDEVWSLRLSFTMECLVYTLKESIRDWVEHLIQPPWAVKTEIYQIQYYGFKKEVKFGRCFITIIRKIMWPWIECRVVFVGTEETYCSIWSIKIGMVRAWPNCNISLFPLIQCQSIKQCQLRQMWYQQSDDGR